MYPYAEMYVYTIHLLFMFILCVLLVFVVSSFELLQFGFNHIFFMYENIHLCMCACVSVCMQDPYALYVVYQFYIQVVRTGFSNIEFMSKYLGLIQ
jgi:hypothetical protein